MITKLKRNPYIYIWVGALVGMLLSAIMIILLFTLPVSLPVIGGAIASGLALSASIGLVGSVFAGIGVILASGIVGILFAKGLQLVKKGITYFLDPFINKNIAKTSKPLPLNTSTSNNIIGLGIAHQVSTNSSTNEDNSSLLNNIIDELDKINTGTEGWAEKISSLREKLLAGNEKRVLDELRNFGDSSRNRLISRLQITDHRVKDIEELLKNGLLKKLRIMFHPDKCKSELATDIAQQLDRWWDETRELLRNNLSAQEYADLEKKWDEDISQLTRQFNELRTGIEKLDLGIERLDAGQNEIDKGLKRLDEGIARVMRGQNEIQAGMLELNNRINQFFIANLTQDDQAVSNHIDSDRHDDSSSSLIPVKNPLIIL